MYVLLKQFPFRGHVSFQGCISGQVGFRDLLFTTFAWYQWTIVGDVAIFPDIQYGYQQIDMLERNDLYQTIIFSIYAKFPCVYTEWEQCLPELLHI